MLQNLKKNPRHFYINVIFIFRSKAIKNTSYSSDKCMKTCPSAGLFEGGNVKKKTIIPVSVSFCQNPKKRLALFVLSGLSYIRVSDRLCTIRSKELRQFTI